MPEADTLREEGVGNKRLAVVAKGSAAAIFPAAAQLQPGERCAKRHNPTRPPLVRKPRGKRHHGRENSVPSATRKVTLTHPMFITTINGSVTTTAEATLVTISIIRGSTDVSRLLSVAVMCGVSRVAAQTDSGSAAIISALRPTIWDIAATGIGVTTISSFTMTRTTPVIISPTT